MKSIQIEVDEELLAAVAKDKDFRATEVSQFFRRAAKFFCNGRLKTKLAKYNPVFDSLKDSREDIYKLNDGKPFYDKSK